MDNLTNEWLDLIRDEAVLKTEFQKYVDSQIINKLFDDISTANSFIDKSAVEIAKKFGFDIDYLWDVEAKFDYTFGDMDIFAGDGKLASVKIVKILTCYIHAFFLHEKIS